MLLDVPTLPTEWSTLVALLRHRAALQPDCQAYIFLPDGETEEIALTYEALDRRARAIAGLLQSLGLSGQRALLVYHPGLEYIAAFFGCLYAGVVAVPTYPPSPQRPAQRLQTIVEDAQASIALTSSQILATLERRLVLNPTLASLQWVATDGISSDLAGRWQEPSITWDTFAFLQYTSGSTSHPKGVLLTHSNLLYNSELIFRCCQHGSASCSVSWLPPYHDMGLIGGILQPLYAGRPVYLMPPAAFLQRPLRWLQVISRVQAEISAAPNFAYDLCVRKIPPQQRKDLDLRNWSMASTGSEPVREETLERFVTAFSACGFRREAFYPCYGLAEATLVVSGGKKADPPNIFHARRTALEQHEVVEASEAADDFAVALVSCGRTMPGQKIVIVDPETLTLCPPGRIGEIWIAGQSVARGYWQLAQETASTFHAYLNDTGEGPFLRSGDLGFLRNGELFVTGRRKDLIIIRGRNHYPQDIEETAQRSHPALRTGCGAAFSVDINSEEHLVLVYEVERQYRHVDVDQVAAVIRRAVARQHGLHIYAVVLLVPGSIPKTTSGKIQRQACRSGFLEGSLRTIGSSFVQSLPVLQQKDGYQSRGLLADDVAHLPHPRESSLIDCIAQVIRVPASRLEPEQLLTDLGLDSLMAVELGHMIETKFGVNLPVTRLIEGMSIQQLAMLIATAGQVGERPRQEGMAIATGTVLPIPQGEYRFSLAAGQRALWFLHHLAPESTAYNITRSVRLLGDLDIPVLHQAFQALVDRHSSLRTTFTLVDEEPMQQVHAHQVVFFEVENACGWSEDALRTRLVEEARQPFDLAQGPLLRVKVFVRSPQESVLFLSIHHIVADFWSLSVLVHELEVIYSARRTGRLAALPPLHARYSDYVSWLADLEDSPDGTQQRKYWLQRLSPPPATIELPTDHSRPSSQPTHLQPGASYAFKLEGELCEQLKRLARLKNATLNAVLLAGFQALLYRYSGQEDIVIGIPAAGRSRAEWAGVVGYFVNALAIRATFEDSSTFAGLIEQTRERVFEAIEHQDYPLSLLVEQLQPVREASRSPLFQIMFAFQQAPSFAVKELAEFALDMAGSSMSIDGLTTQTLSLEPQFAQFDLRLMMAECGEELGASIEYSADLFEVATIERLADHYRCLLEAMVANPNQRVGEAAMLTESERQQILVIWNATEVPSPIAPNCLHELFERQAERTPESVAIVYGEKQLTYRELEQRANQLAHYLKKFGVGPEVRVGICLERSFDLVVGMLGVLKAGGAYVPLDPTYPQAQLAFMIEDAAMSVLLTQEKLRAHVPETATHIVCLDSEWKQIARQSKKKLGWKGHRGNLAYVIYTSGSTGVPKGVQVVHQGLVNLVHWHLAAFAVSAQDRATHLAGLSFDASAWELWPYLAVGASVFLVDDETRLSPSHLSDYLDEHAITICFAPTPLVEAMLRSERWPSTMSLRILLTGGDTLHSYPQVPLPFRLVNNYGTTENTVVATSIPVAWREGCADDRPSIGFPITNTQVYILDSHYQPVPVGVPGELYVGGKGVARGYLDRPALTAEKFVPHPFSTRAGDRLYRTGDRARYRSDGSIEFLGRFDYQVKLRGFRIELGEIEAVLGEHPLVQENVVVVRENETGEKRLIAYVVLGQRGEENWRRELRVFLGKRLPEYMLPSAFVPVDVLPLTPNGKIDRRALPAPPTQGDEMHLAPRNPVEEVLVGLWADVLGLVQVGIEDNFFDLGGHSLLATRLLSRLHESLQVAVPLRQLFETPTIAGLARSIEPLLHRQSAWPASPIEPVSRQRDLPLSFAQERLWFLDQLVPDSPLYNIALAQRLCGPLDRRALEKSLNELLRRHESLRTTFVMRQDQPVQVIAPSLSLPLPLIDLRALATREQEVERLAREEGMQPFELAHGPLLRARLLWVGEQEHVLLLSMHHIISDGWSMGIVAHELAALYQAFSAGLPSPLPPLPIQYADFACWQRGWLQGELLESQLSYWRQQLAGAPALLELPTDHPRPAVQSFRGAQHRFLLPAQLSEQVKALSRQEGVTLFMTLLAAFQTLLARYSGQQDVLVGSPVANRRKVETEALIGFFANTLVLRTNLAGDPSFREVLRRVREVTLAAYDHQDLPFEKLVESLQFERSLSHNPLFQAVFTLQDAPTDLELAGLRLQPLEVESGMAKFDLMLSLTDDPRGLVGVLEYNTDLFEAGRIERMADHLQTLLGGVVAAPEQRLSDLPLLTEAERQQLLIEWNETRTAYPRDKCLHELFEEQARCTPATVAVVFGEQEVSYDDLNRRANQLAHYLRALNVGPEVRVGICMERSLDLIVGLLGILKAGGAYVPLDPTYPHERLAFMLQDARVQVLLTQQRLLAALPEQEARIICLDSDWQSSVQGSEEPPPGGVLPDNLAYVTYTSGSTGLPKGVGITQRNVVRLVKETAYARLTAEEVFLHLAPISFDASTFEIWGCLLNGGRLVVFPAYTPSLEDLGQALERYQITALWLPAGLFHQMVERQSGSLKHVRQLLAGGDVLSVAHVTQALVSGGTYQLINGYGPTENTTFTCCYSMREFDQVRESVPIGRPIANTEVYVLDHSMKPVPVGVPGELYIGGDGLARGYLNRPELTADRFVPHPFSHEPGSRLYKTGDVVRYWPDGNIEFLGRLDQQVKIRGFRVEPGEVEAVLSHHPAVREVIVVAREDIPGDKRLVAYAVPEQMQVLATSELRSFLRELLPDYMLPSAFVMLDALPLTANGKVDRGQLPAPSQINAKQGAGVAQARTAIEEVLVGLWADVLGLVQVGIEDNFFDLGGHSLLATRLLSRLHESLQVAVPLRQLFETPTIAGLARSIEPLLHRQSAWPASPIEPVSRQRDLPLSFAQERLWFLDQLVPDSPLYNIALAQRLCGPLDRRALEKSLNELLRRHESLRTTFVMRQDQPVQVIAPSLSLPLPLIDLRALATREQEVERLAREEGMQPFELAHGPLLRARLLWVGEQEHVLLLSMHHIISDGWSMGIVAHELAALYQAFSAGLPSPLPPLPIQYADFACWQRGWLQGELLESQLSYWRQQLAGAPALLELPTDHPRPAVQSFRGAQHRFLLPAQLSEQVKALSRQEGVTLFMTLLAAFQTLLARYSGQQDVLVGSPVANRRKVETEALIGFFANTLVLRTNLAGDPSFREVLRRVREVTLAAYDHQDLPFEKLVEELRPERTMSHNPLFQVMFALQNVPGMALPLLHGASTVRDGQQDATGPLSTLGAVASAAKFDLSLFIEETDQGLLATWEYSTDLFDAATIRRWSGHLHTLLDGIVAKPDQRISALPLLTEAERRQLLIEWNNTQVQSFDKQTIHELFEAQVERTPEAAAAIFGDERLTYRELEQRANQLARYLQRLGVGPEVRVGVCLERTSTLIVSLLAIFKAGGAYVPLDPGYPQNRLTFMLEDAQVKILLTQRRFLDKLGGNGVRVVCVEGLWEAVVREHLTPLKRPMEGRNLAYVLYTSGSTGSPKAVALTHENAVGFLHWVKQAFTAEELANVLASTSICFDLSVFELFGPLVWGGCVILAEDVLSLLEGDVAQEVTLINTVPSLMGESLRVKPLTARVRCVNLAGEPLPLSLVQRIYQHGTVHRVLNLYGPSEATTYVTSAVLRSDSAAVTIGRPISNVQLYILDARLQPLPVGVPGELYIGGPCLARGYLNRPELTAERFLPHPFSPEQGARLYKTGDIVRYLQDGTIEFLGRKDDQVKVQGVRIELGEIEAILQQQPAVQQCAVVVQGNEHAEKRLVACVVCDPEHEEFSASQLRNSLQESLPRYMLPSLFVILDALPLTSNGKIDRTALSSLEIEGPEREDTYVSPRNPLEQVLVSIWTEVLGLEQIGVYDNFFSLGGDSLLATRIISRVHETFGVNPSLRSLFEEPTIANLARAIEEQEMYGSE